MTARDLWVFRSIRKRPPPLRPLPRRARPACPLGLGPGLKAVPFARGSACGEISLRGLDSPRGEAGRPSAYGEISPHGRGLAAARPARQRSPYGLDLAALAFLGFLTFLRRE